MYFLPVLLPTMNQILNCYGTYRIEVTNKYCKYLQYKVSRQEAIRTLSRTVIIQTFHKDAIKVSSTDLNTQFHLDPLQPNQPRLSGPAGSRSM